jgi:predicted kinase
VLLLINGPPGIGKSRVARRYLDDHPRALVVEIDTLRTQLGGWSRDDASRQLARELAVDLIDGHLRRGHDVVVPQYLGRPEFRDRLSTRATEAGVPFVEVVLAAPVDLVEARFRARRHALGGADHPEADVPDDAVHVAIADATAHLTADTEDTTRIVIDASGDEDATYDALIRALGGPGRAKP